MYMYMYMYMYVCVYIYIYTHNKAFVHYDKSGLGEISTLQIGKILR